MNSSSITLEICVIALGMVLMLADFFVAPDRKRYLAYAGIVALAGLLLVSFSGDGVCSIFGASFSGSFIEDPMALFFKRLFIGSAILVLFMAAEFSDRFASGLNEYYSLVVFALAGMLFAASANDFVMLFVSIELITITFYVLTSFQKNRLASLEAAVKYLILGALASAFMVFGIALIWGTSGELNFNGLAQVSGQFVNNKLFLAGCLFVLVGLGFKIAAFPFQVWAPDVYQGAPTPTTAFLAIGSKAAGFVLLLRVLFVAIPAVTHHWVHLLMALSAITILYGNLCAMPQRNLKRMLGYSSIAHAGYLLLGVAALNSSGQAAVMYYLAGYLFTVTAAFFVIALVLRHVPDENVSGLAGLNHRSPLLATTMTISMVSLAGIPPLAGFFGKFLLLKAIIEQGPAHHGYYLLAFIALVGVIISISYYFNVIRAIYWTRDPADLSPITVSGPARFSIAICVAGIFWLGLFPESVLNFAMSAASAIK